MTTTPNTDVSALSFEKAVEELESIVSALERGDVALDRSIEIYERGEALKKHCEALLNAAENLESDTVIMGIFIIGIFAFAFDLLIRYLEKVLIPWKGRI